MTDVRHSFTCPIRMVCAACNDDVVQCALLPCFHVLCLSCATDEKEQQQHCPFPVTTFGDPLVCGVPFKYGDLLFVELAQPDPGLPNKRRNLNNVTLTSKQQSDIDDVMRFLTRKNRLLSDLVTLLRSRRAEAAAGSTTDGSLKDEVTQAIDANIKAVELVRDELAVLLEHVVCAKRLVSDMSLPEQARAAALVRLLALDEMVFDNDIPVEITPRLTNGDLVCERIYPPQHSLYDAKADLRNAKYRIARDFSTIRQPQHVIKADSYNASDVFIFCVSSQGYIVAIDDKDIIILARSGELIRRIPSGTTYHNWIAATSDGSVWVSNHDASGEENICKYDVSTGELLCHIAFKNLGLPKYCRIHALAVTPDDRIVLYVNRDSEHGTFAEQPPLIMLDANGNHLRGWCTAETFSGCERPRNFSGFTSCTATSDHVILTYENDSPNILKFSLEDGSFVSNVTDEFLSEFYWLIAYERTSDLTFFCKECNLRVSKVLVDIIARTSLVEEDENTIVTSFAGIDYYENDADDEDDADDDMTESENDWRKCSTLGGIATGPNGMVVVLNNKRGNDDRLLFVF